MDVSALNLAMLATGTEEATAGAPATTAIDGAAFAKLMSGLGAAALPLGTDAASAADRLVAADQPAEGAPPPADPALLLQAIRMTPAAVRPKGETRTAAPDARDAPAPAAASDAPTTESLGLPPLLAALVAPTLAQAAPVAVAPAARDDAASAMPAVTGPVPPPAALAAALPVTSAPPTAPPVAVAPAPAMPATPAMPAPGAAPDGAATGPAEPAANSPAAAVPPADGAIAAAPAVATPVTGPAATRARSVAAPSPPAELAAATRPPPVAAANGLPAAAVFAPRRAPTAGAPVAAEAVSPSEGPAKADPPAEAAVPLAPRPMAGMPSLAMVAEPGAPAVAAASDAAPAAQPLIEHQLDMAREGEWLDQLTRDIVRTASAEGSLRFRLNPEHLGSLEVEVTQGQAGASVRLTADTEQARSLLADARPQLIAEARAQGVRIAEAHVDLGGRPEGQGGQSAAQSQAGNGGRGGRDVPAQEYLTSWQPESVEEEPSRSRRSSAERYA